MDSLIGDVPDDWMRHRLAEVCDVLAGPTAPRVNQWERVPTDVPVVTIRDLRDNWIADQCTAYVNHETADRLAHYRLLPGDIVCARTGQLGHQALVRPNQRGWFVGSSCLRLRVRHPISAPYLSHYLGHPAVRDWIVRNASGGVIPSISTRMLGSLPVVVPTTAVQTAIADILGALDEKIIIHEQIARATSALRDELRLRLLSDGVNAEAIISDDPKGG